MYHCYCGLPLDPSHCWLLRFQDCVMNWGSLFASVYWSVFSCCHSYQSHCTDTFSTNEIGPAFWKYHYVVTNFTMHGNYVEILMLFDEHWNIMFFNPFSTSKFWHWNCPLGSYLEINIKQIWKVFYIRGILLGYISFTRAYVCYAVPSAF